MIEQIYTYFTIEMIYLWLNIGVLPFWLTLLFFPQSKICKIFVTSIFPILIFVAVDIYLIVEFLKNNFGLLEGFNLYIGLSELINLLSDENFVLFFWIHFLAINLFCGCWIVRDYQKIEMPKIFASFTLIITYFAGPLGLFVYWFIRVFFGKKIDLYD